ncbi:MAG: NAD-dependent epimerase/dehydratase family protein [Candidatus Nanohaloarchaea archaeon]
MIAVTGGAGFIGSNLVEALLEEGYNVKVIDNLSSGRKEFIPEEAKFVEMDINDSDLAGELEAVETVFHLAANPHVNKFPEDREIDFEINMEGTKNVLDACIDAGVNEFVFTSSSTVYGEDAEIPTPEEHVFDPISMYGATKAAGEHFAKVYSQIFDLDITLLRLANIVGSRAEKGVTYDFVQKLKANPEELEILGNGRQRKSYIYINDTISGIITAWKSDKQVFNIGSEDSISVTEIAEAVSDEMELDPEFSYTGGRKGWKGDVPQMRLEVSKLKEEGWKPEKNSEQAIRETARNLL